MRKRILDKDNQPVWASYFYTKEQGLQELTQLAFTPFIVSYEDKDICFCCVKQYIIYNQLIMFPDNEDKIKQLLPDPSRPIFHIKDIMAAAKDIKNFDTKIWFASAQQIALEANLFKFWQNKKLRDILLSTRTDILIETNPYDKYWGIGAAEPSNMLEWQGKNIFGQSLMETRKIISEKF